MLRRRSCSARCGAHGAHEVDEEGGEELVERQHRGRRCWETELEKVKFMEELSSLAAVAAKELKKGEFLMNGHA